MQISKYTFKWNESENVPLNVGSICVTHNGISAYVFLNADGSMGVNVFDGPTQQVKFNDHNDPEPEEE